MILVDTSVWRDHLRAGEPALAVLLEAGSALIHPIIVAELALTALVRRDLILEALSGLPRIQVATEVEVLQMIRDFALAGLGLTYVDLHLLASLRHTRGAGLWTKSALLQEVALQLGFAFAP